ncbi:low molecular weight phosphotyrosine protein phosphatase [Nocardioidaceae bacterium]|nr:low molecular weight phosphotyrosine protein phosphatase [Nocardioidaceae bacterium]
MSTRAGRHPQLPPPRADRDADAPAYAIALVCLGNICRSPTAHVVLEAALRDAGLGDRVAVSSGGTGGWHVGDPIDRRAAATLDGAGYDPSGPRAEQVDASWFSRHDLVLAMDTDNLADLRGLAHEAGRTGVEVGPERLRLFRDFDPALEVVEEQPGTVFSPPARERVVPDPYYGGDEGFTRVLEMVERTSAELSTQAASLLPS